VVGRSFKQRRENGDTHIGHVLTMSTAIDGYGTSDIAAAMVNILVDAGAPRNIAYAEVTCLALGIMAPPRSTHTLLQRADEDTLKRASVETTTISATMAPVTVADPTNADRLHSLIDTRS